MKRSYVAFAVLALAVLVVVLVAGRREVWARQQAVISPSAEQLRFQLIGNEPIAGPDGRALVKDWSVLMFKDRRSGECYVTFARGSSIAAANVVECPK